MIFTFELKTTVLQNFGSSIANSHSRNTKFGFRKKYRFNGSTKASSPKMNYEK